MMENETLTIGQILVTNFVPVLTSAVGIVTTWGLAELSRWLRSKTKNENAKMALDSITLITRSVVAEVNAQLKVAGEDGRITKEEGYRIKLTAEKMIRRQLPKAVTKQAQNALGNLEEFISSRIEREVDKQKAEKANKLGGILE